MTIAVGSYIYAEVNKKNGSGFTMHIEACLTLNGGEDRKKVLVYEKMKVSPYDDVLLTIGSSFDFVFRNSHSLSSTF